MSTDAPEEKTVTEPPDAITACLLRALLEKPGQWRHKSRIYSHVCKQLGGLLDRETELPAWEASFKAALAVGWLDRGKGKSGPPLYRLKDDEAIRWATKILRALPPRDDSHRKSRQQLAGKVPKLITTGVRGVHINPDYPPGSGEACFVIASYNEHGAATGYETLGQRVCQERIARLQHWMNFTERVFTWPDQAYLPGSGEQYAYYRELMNDVRAHCERHSKRCPAELTLQLIGLEDKRVEVVDGDGQTRRFWVSRSTGWMPCHLEVYKLGNRQRTEVAARQYRSVHVL